MAENFIFNHNCNNNSNSIVDNLLNFLNKTEQTLNIYAWFLLEDNTSFRNKLFECINNLIKKNVTITFYLSDNNYFGVITNIFSKIVEKIQIDFDFIDKLKDIGVNIIYIENTHIKCMISDNKRVYIGGRNLMGSYWQCDYNKNYTNFMDMDFIFENEQLANKLNHMLDPESNLYGYHKVDNFEIFYEKSFKTSLWNSFLLENMKKAKKQIIIHNSNIENSEIICDLIELKNKIKIPIKIYTNKTLSSDYVSKNFELYTLSNSYFYHSKLYIIDDDIYIGSYNIDPVSEVINNELLIKIPNKYNNIEETIHKEYLQYFKLYKSDNSFLSIIKRFIYKIIDFFTLFKN